MMTNSTHTALTIVMVVGLAMVWQALAIAQSATPTPFAGSANITMAADRGGGGGSHSGGESRGGGEAARGGGENRGGGESHGGGGPAFQPRGGGDGGFHENDRWGFRDRGDNDDFGLGLYVNPYANQACYWDPSIGDYICPEPEDDWGLSLRF